MKPTQSRIPSNAKIQWAGGIIGLLTLFFAAGCETTKSDPLGIRVVDSLDQAPAFSGNLKYVMIYNDRESDELAALYSEDLDSTLAQLGYVKGTPEDADLAIHVAIKMDELTTKTHRVDYRHLIGASNPDSIRYKNLANGPGTQLGGNLGGGGLSVNDSLHDIGGIKSGPGGQQIAVGDEKDRQLEHGSPNTVNIDYRSSYFEITALEVPIPNDPLQIKIPWQVKVSSEVVSDKPRANIQDLVQAATERLLEKHPEPSA